MASNDQLTHTDQSDVILKIGENLHLNEEMADFHFVFEIADGQYERVPAHKLLLKTASDVFSTMFNGSWEENDEVEIKDATIDEFKEFLQFFYLGEVKISMDKVARVMYLGDKYNITRCLNVCEQFIINILKEDNACWAYELALVYDQENLKKYCETFIGINTKSVLASDNFMDCNSKTLGHILKLDLLSYPENEIFEACMNWVKANAEVDQLTRNVVQDHFGAAFYDIRIKSMTPQGYAQLLPSYGHLFTIDELMDISQAVAIPEFQPNFFSKTIRTTLDDYKYNENDVLYCSRIYSNFISVQPYFFKSVETTRFSTNTPLFLIKFTCSTILRKLENNVYQHAEDLPIEITIVQVPISENSGDEIVLYNGKYGLQSETNTIVTLPKSILVMPGCMYEIRLNQSSPETYCTGALLKEEVEIEPNITVKFHGDPVLENDIVAGGTILGLGFDRLINKISSTNRRKTIFIN